MSKLEDCIDETIAGFTGRTCGYNGQEMVHRGTIADLAADFESEGWYTEEYSLYLVNHALTVIHQSAMDNGMFINLVGPGRHNVLIPVLDDSGEPLIIPVADLNFPPPEETENWTCDGVDGQIAYTADGDQLHVCGNEADNGGSVFVVQPLYDHAERWLLTVTGDGLSPIQELRRYQGDIAWANYEATLDNGRVAQIYVEADAVEAKGNRVKARRLRREAAALENSRTTSMTFTSMRVTDMEDIRDSIPWLQSLELV